MNKILIGIIIYIIVSYIINIIISMIMIKKMKEPFYTKNVHEKDGKPFQIDKMFMMGVYILIVASPITMPFMIYKVVFGKGD